MTTPPIVVLPPVVLLPFLLLEGGRPRRAAMGMWTAYAPARQLKLHHAVDGRLHCLARVAPRRDRLDAATDPNGIWRRAFATPVTRRAAENWVMLRRLHRAGLGPEPFAVALAPRYRSWFTRGTTVSAGVVVADLRRYPPKAPATEAELRAAGVLPDARRSCLREHINGWVSDLNSARGAMPEDAEEEVAALADRLDSALAQARAAG